MKFGTDKNETNKRNTLIEKAIRKYADTIYRIAYQYTCNSSDAQDIFQEVALTLVTANPPFEDECYLRNWICRVTVNKCKNLKRFRLAHIFEPLDENIAANERESDYLSEELLKLPKKYRTVLYLFYFEEFSIEEISGILGIKPNTVGSQLRRGRERLRKIIEEGEENCV